MFIVLFSYLSLLFKCRLLVKGRKEEGLEGVGSSKKNRGESGRDNKERRKEEEEKEELPPDGVFTAFPTLRILR